MKYSITIVSLLTVMIASSCTKTYTCSCHYYDKGTIKVGNTDVKAANYSKATTKCQQYLNSTHSLDCTLQ